MTTDEELSIPVISLPLYNPVVLSRFGRSARGDENVSPKIISDGMALGIVTVALLYWLCRRTAINELGTGVRSRRDDPLRTTGRARFVLRERDATLKSPGELLR